MAMTRHAPYLYEDDEHVAVAPSRVARASLHAVPGGKKATQPRATRPQHDEEEWLTTGTTGMRGTRVPRNEPHWSLRSVPDTRVTPLATQRTPGLVQHWSRRVPISWWIVLGMVAMAVLGLIFVRVGVWYMNAFYDPAY